VPRILVDADGCPVKAEVYRVAERYGVGVVLVANTRIRTPREVWIQLVTVKGKLDAADDWIVEQAARDDIVVTDDIPLAARCLGRGARVIGSRGRVFTEDSIGEALAARALSAHLRELGTMTGGPAGVGPRDRSRFLQRLDELVRACAPGPGDRAGR
jgi:uncharacterized protein YaiI (UPF0178 family)